MSGALTQSKSGVRKAAILLVLLGLSLIHI